MSADGKPSAESGAAGAGVPVVRLGAGEGARRYELDEEALRRVLLRRDAQDLPAVVLSVAGAYRGGKSFILDFFLRYLNAPRSSQLSGEWMGREDERLKGFHCRGGGDRDTTGIYLWPEPIITTLSNGEKVAVLLMDTQGTFDSESTIEQNSAIFALSSLISSVQIYNLSGNITEVDLQHLQLFTEYGKLACAAEGKAFQTLLFLVRDWIYPYDHAHGFAGGDALLRKRLQEIPTELGEVREHIRSCFDSIKCFLMPHPGLDVEDQSFAGCLRDLTEKFRLALLELVPALLAPEHLTPKLVNGERVRTQDLFEYFRKYIAIFNSGEVPQAPIIKEINSFFENFEKVNNSKKNIAMQAAECAYQKYIIDAWGSGPSDAMDCCIHPQKLLAVHKKAMDEAVKMLLANGADDASKESLVEILGAHYHSILENTNKIIKEKSVEKALSKYTTKMDAYTRTKLTTWGLYIFRAWGYTVGLNSQHEIAKAFAIADFRSRHRGDVSPLIDPYLVVLIQKIDAAFRKYQNPWEFLLSGKMQ